MKENVGMSPHEKEREQEDPYIFGYAQNCCFILKRKHIIQKRTI